MAIIVPNTASIIDVSGCIIGSRDVWAWFGFQTATASGSCMWYQTAASTVGYEIMGISLSPMQQVLYGPFNSPCGLSAASISGGCAVVMLKLP